MRVMKLFFVGILCVAMLGTILFTMSYNSAFAENEILATSVEQDNLIILELKNNSENGISSVRIWLSGDNSFQSFTTDEGWIGKNTPQGVIIFTTQDPVNPGQSVKFGIETIISKPVINWKALDSNENIIKSGTISTNTETSEADKIDQSKSNTIKINSSFRIIPDTLSHDYDFRVIGKNFGADKSLNFLINDKIMKSFLTDSNGNFIITSTITKEIELDRTRFLIADSIGVEKELSIRLIEIDKRTIGKTSELIFDEIPMIVTRGDTVMLKGDANPETTLTITTKQETLGIISIDTIITGSDGKWEFENIFSPQLELEKISIIISDGKSEIIRDVDIISSKKININSIEPRYEQGETIMFSGSAIANNDLLVYLEDPKSSEVFSDVISVDSSGIVNFEISISTVAMKGTYILHVNQGNEESISVVGVGMDPVDVIVVSTSKLNYKTNDVIDITIQGKPNVTANLLIIDDASTEKLSNTIEIGADGIYKFEVNADTLSSGAFTIQVRYGEAKGNSLFTIGLAYGSGPILMQTTKSDYNPGEQILLMGNTGKNSLLSISLYDSDDNLLKKIETYSNKDGSFRTDKFRIPNDPKIGEWVIKAKSGGNIAESSFSVSKILESIIVKVDRDSLTYSNSEIVNISGAGANPSTAITIAFFDNDNNNLDENLVVYATNIGEFNTNWIIPDSVIPGNLEILVTNIDTHGSVIITVN